MLVTSLIIDLTSVSLPQYLAHGSCLWSICHTELNLGIPFEMVSSLHKWYLPHTQVMWTIREIFLINGSPGKVHGLL